ncbi:MAG: YceI family protein [Ferruginibacter sp.]|nr:YceI family protein [Ferruginibacter sp.]
MKKSILFIALIAATGSLFAQKKMTTSGTVNFDATTSLDQLPKAENKTVIAAIDTKNGNIGFEVPMKNFTFGNPRIQEHFNGPKWLDSEKFPTATFKGGITNIASVNFSKDGTYDADVAGDLTIHGVTKPVKSTGKITVNGKTVSANTEFTIKLEDYGVDGPQIAAGKISKEPKIMVSADLQ